MLIKSQACQYLLFLCLFFKKALTKTGVILEVAQYKLRQERVIGSWCVWEILVKNKGI